MHSISTNIIFKFYLFISAILIIAPLSQYKSLTGPLDDGDLEMYIIFLLAALLLVFSMMYIFGLFRPIKYITYDKVFNKNLIILISIMCFIWFLFFVIKEINSIDDLLIFSERYRNSYYKGSGIYTYPILIVMPSFLLLILIKQRKLDTGFYLPFLLIFIASYVVGLRIFLFGIILILFIRMFIFNKNIIKIIIFFGLFFLFLISYKYFLNDSVSEMSFLDMVSYIIGRLKFEVLLEFNGFNIGFEDLNFSSISSFKEDFLSFNNDISYGLPNLKLYTGVALPLTVVLYNIMYVFLIPLLALCLLIIMKLLRLLIETKSLEKSAIYVNIFIIFMLILLENVAVVVKLPIILTISVIIVLALKVNKVKLSI